MYRFWLEKCGNCARPARADIDPIEMPKRLLRGICLIDIVTDERRYVYRLVGIGDVEVRGNDPTGKSVLEGPGFQLAFFNDGSRRIGLCS